MLKLYTDDYITLNAELHARRPLYGSHGSAWADVAAKLIKMITIRSVLDFGCGKATFDRALKSTVPDIIVTNYDPAIAKYAAHTSLTHEYDLVVCTDVLEHVELDYVTRALGTICGCMAPGAIALLHISLQQSKKTLGDGRNCHVTIRSVAWWMRNIKVTGMQVLSGVYAPGHSLSVVIANNWMRCPGERWLADNMPAKMLGNPANASIFSPGNGLWRDYEAR